MNQDIAEQIKALRQDMEVSAAINIIEGINTIETLAALGHWIQKRRAPTAKEAEALSQAARTRWAAQVRQVLSVMRADGTDLDEKMADLAALLAKPKTAPMRTTKRNPKRKRG